MRALLLALVLLICSAHVGSPDVWFDGAAGPYPIRVHVRPPQVIPGMADITVRVRGGATLVTVTPARSDSGEEGQPTPDIAQVDANDAERFTAQLWLMARGAYRIVIRVSGARGEGTAIVPVTASATTRRPMSPATTAGLMAAAIFLLFGFLSIVGAAVREGVVAPGVAVTAERVTHARRAIAISAAVLALLLVGGWRWWSGVDRAHRANLDRPWAVEAAVDSTGALRFTIVDEQWQQRGRPGLGSRRGVGDIVPDHGKLMHMFLVRDDQSAFAHVHPTTSDQREFRAQLPTLPAGTYRMYADIVHESGYTRTLVDTVDIARAITTTTRIADDDTSWDAATVPLDPSLRWIGPPSVVAGQEIELGAEAVYDTGAPVEIVPYMGMRGHAVVERNDGLVFVHLHPLGTISMAAQRAVAAKTIAAPEHDAHAAHDGTVTFPYAFPTAGRYRVWIQVRTNLGVITAAFDVSVTE